jgi:hypothetical protein
MDGATAAGVVNGKYNSNPSATTKLGIHAGVPTTLLHHFVDGG